MDLSGNLQSGLSSRLYSQVGKQLDKEFKPKQAVPKGPVVTAGLQPKHKKQKKLDKAAATKAVAAPAVKAAPQAPGQMGFLKQTLRATEKHRQFGLKPVRTKEERVPQKFAPLPVSMLTVKSDPLLSASAPTPASAGFSPAEESAIVVAKQAYEPEEEEEEDRVETFVGSLGLDVGYEREFKTGNFIYMRLKEDPMNRTAYNLEVCEHFDVDNNNYYTLSGAGVTHFLKGEPDFTTIGDWEREFFLFNMIRRVPFFKKYRTWKSFLEWKKTVKRGKLSMSSAVLLKDSFMFMPALRGALLQLRNICYDLGTSRLISVARDRVYNLDDFCEEQWHTQHAMVKKLTEFSDDICTLAKTACEELVDRFLQDNNIVADVKMTFMERAALRTECNKLTKFLRLADFLVMDSLWALALESYDDLLAHISPPRAADHKWTIHVDDTVNVDVDKEKFAAGGDHPLFSVEVTFDEGGEIKCVPGHRDFATRMAEVVRQSISCVGIPARLLGHRDLVAYTMPDGEPEAAAVEGEGGGQSLETSVLGDAHCKTALSAVYQGLEAALDETMQYTEVFLPFKDTFMENRAVSE
jgi:dynein heavy chain